jgi:hypothetical protein
MLVLAMRASSRASRSNPHWTTVAAREKLGSYWGVWMARKTKDTEEQKKKYEIFGEKLEELKLVMRKELEPKVWNSDGT